MSSGGKSGLVETHSRPSSLKKEGGERSREKREEQREEDVFTEQAWPQEPVLLLLQAKDLCMTGLHRAHYGKDTPQSGFFQKGSLC